MMNINIKDIINKLKFNIINKFYHHFLNDFSLVDVRPFG